MQFLFSLAPRALAVACALLLALPATSLAQAYGQYDIRQLLSVQPDDAWANYHYGHFLASTARPKEALPYLVRARDKGVVSALYALGMTHLSLGDQAKALALLAEYQKARPSDAGAAKLVQAIREGKVEVRRSGAASP